MEQTWVKQLRSEFYVTRDLTFFDVAYENCGSVFAKKAIDEYFEDKHNLYPGMPKAGGSGKGRTVQVVAETREKLARLLHLPDAHGIGFTANTCMGISLIVAGFPFEAGDEIVIADNEHVSVLMPCIWLQHRGVKLNIVHPADGLGASAEELLAAVTEKTRMVVVSYVQSTSGYRVDLKKLCDECHRRGVYVVTDAIQALGFIDVNVPELGVDAMAASGYKGMLATEGAGFFYCGDKLLAKLEPVLAGPNQGLAFDRENCAITCPDPLNVKKMETGTLPFASLYTLRAGVDKLLEIGMESIEAHTDACFEKVYSGLQALGYTMGTGADKATRCHSMLVCTGQNEAMTRFMEEQGVFISCGRPGYVRVSVAPFTDETDIDRLLAAAKEWLKVTSDR